ncbi:MAG: carbamate kinase [Candidatus Krumholzibacteria bacterium]|nr:carbamate kinase [Candidatus Krumholzibacteria bacterium]MDH4337465.1 carbamate kinase [Candidatus Krumholzibacteria bacterium]MDH5270155.1 carbamate kinase [Candidatus Krumholzibacteria bacterium]
MPRRRIVIALGGNALLKRGEPLTVANQRANVRAAALAIAPITDGNDIVISHGNGPQVGMLALQAAHSDSGTPLDVLGAETEGMIGYMIEQELGNCVPFERPLATMLTMVEVDPDDPAFQNPTKPIGPMYTEAEAKQLAEQKGWTVAADGTGWRRVVPSPLPKRIFEIRPIKWLIEKQTIVICAGGGGIPTMYRGETLVGAEVVIDKDRASAVLAREVNADLLVLATDVAGVFADWGTANHRLIRHATPAQLREQRFGAGSMGPKVEAAIAFVKETGKRAAIGSLEEIGQIVAGEAGTIIERS